MDSSPFPRIYLDHCASTPLDPEVEEACIRALRDHAGNPSSLHAEGAAARSALEQAREQVAALIGARPDEIVFTSGATESNGLALHGLVRGSAEAAGAARRAVTSAVEHPSVAEPLAALEDDGLEITRLAVGADGRLDLASLEAALRDGPALVSIQHANHETGVRQPLAAIAASAKQRGAWLHSDASQALGRLPIDVGSVAVDLLSGSAHKLNGPKGAGFLYVRRGVPLAPLLRGGPQERRRRAGTPSLVGAVGLGAACALARREGARRAAESARLRDRLWEGIVAKVPGVVRHGAATDALPHVLNVEFRDVAGEALLAALDLEGVAVSTGAACSSGSLEPSPVLLAMGVPPARARCAIRLSVGLGVDDAKVDHVLTLLPDLVARIRAAAGPA
ncbi:MAG TPA: cysteine desulfurase family protein [Myxococcota bacterium]|jgi:cysteine desulfurase|nr:cysteine desulfurase family protein [Myxococcota bacterium]